MSRYGLVSWYYRVMRTNFWGYGDEIFIDNFCNFMWVSYSFFIFIENGRFIAFEFLVRKEWFNCSPEIVVRLFAFLWEIIFDGLFSNGHNSAPFPSILFPVALSEFLEFVPGHVSGIEGFAKPGIHIGYRLIFYKLWFHRGMEINNICYQCACVPCHVVDIVKDFGNMEGRTGHII